jgi:hypothetical protein
VTMKLVRISFCVILGERHATCGPGIRCLSISRSVGMSSPDLHGAGCYSYQRQQGGLEGPRATLRHLNLGFLDEALYEGCSDGHHDRSFH